MAGKTNAGVAVSVAQSADVGPGGGGGGIHEQRVHCKETGAGKNPSVGHFVPPALEGQSGQIYEGNKEGLLLLPALLL